MWNLIRGAPYTGRDEIISGNFGNQYVLETRIVATICKPSFRRAFEFIAEWGSEIFSSFLIFSLPSSQRWCWGTLPHWIGFPHPNCSALTSAHLHLHLCGYLFPDCVAAHVRLQDQEQELSLPSPVLSDLQPLDVKEERKKQRKKK